MSTITGSDGNNRLVGTPTDDVISAGGGDDRVVGRTGNDTIDGEGGDDVLSGGSGNDSVSGGDGNDRIYGGEGNDTLDGGNNDDVIWGNAGNDLLTGGAGADTFGFDYGHGNDTITDFDVAEDFIDLSDFATLDSFNDLTLTQSGNDVVIDLSGKQGGQITLQGVTVESVTADNFGFREHLEVTPSEGSTWMYGEAGNDTLTGDEGTNRMMGRRGDDSLDGGAGDDVYYGGEGHDTFVIGLNAGNDTIVDMKDGEDVIDLSAYTAITGFDDLTIRKHNYGGIELDLTGHGGGTVEIHSYEDSIDFDELDASDFIFYDDGD